MLEGCRTLAASLVLSAVLVAFGAPASAQNAPVSASQRDCQTIVRCRFRRGGDYRGCISAYMCRQCRVVTSRNCRDSDPRRPVCRRVVCTWG
jgi:hypothetical protein